MVSSFLIACPSEECSFHAPLIYPAKLTAFQLYGLNSPREHRQWSVMQVTFVQSLKIKRNMHNAMTVDHLVGTEKVTTTEWYCWAPISELNSALQKYSGQQLNVVLVCQGSLGFKFFWSKHEKWCMLNNSASYHCSLYSVLGNRKFVHFYQGVHIRPAGAFLQLQL